MHAMKDKEPPLADISPGGRALRAAKSHIEHFCVGLINGLDAEINKNQNEQTRLNLDHARKWLQGSMKQLIQLAEERRSSEWRKNSETQLGRDVCMCRCGEPD
jgi:hypothetical protein